MGEMQTDPSMEEILASIKRVIAEDHRTQPSRARRGEAAPAAEPAEAEPEDVLELDDPVTEHGSLLSSDAAAASRARLAALSTLRGQPEVIADAGPLEAVIRDMLRPMLKEWLDENLPGIVEQLVTREIARITGRKF
jgi:cell pole-organizing protein PopZ